jgi:macrodomain Ter protein organizer (MatP/YcbG family)
MTVPNSKRIVCRNALEFRVWAMLNFPYSRETRRQTIVQLLTTGETAAETRRQMAVMGEDPEPYLENEAA